MRLVRARSLSPLSVVAVICLALVSGCGGDGDANGSEEVSARRAVVERQAAAFATRLANLIATSERKQDCDLLQEISSRSRTTFPCPAERDFRRSMARFEVTGTAAYGTGAVIEYKSGTVKDNASILLYVDPRGEWAVSRFGLLNEPAVGTSDDANEEGFKKAIDGYLNALNKRDCAAYNDFAYTGSTDEKKVCKTQFPATRTLSTLMSQDGRIDLRYLGGDRIYGFYALELDKPAPRRFTVSLTKTPGGSVEPFVVLDVAEGPAPKAKPGRLAPTPPPAGGGDSAPDGKTEPDGGAEPDGGGQPEKAPAAGAAS